MSTVLLELPAQLGLFTAILLVHNTFGAMQDAAIDAAYKGFQPTFFFVAGAILAVTLFVALPLREVASAARPVVAGVCNLAVELGLNDSEVGAAAPQTSASIR
jgi:PAT family beta-lactamase induction signal transducer AmpG